MQYKVGEIYQNKKHPEVKLKILAIDGSNCKAEYVDACVHGVHRDKGSTRFTGLTTLKVYYNKIKVNYVDPRPSWF